MGFPLDIGYTYIPHPAKADIGGEDAFTISYRSMDGSFLIGVSDGVGSWLSKRGISAGPFANDLMLHSEEVFSEGVDSPMLILEAAYEMTDNVGSATAILGVLNPKTWGYRVEIVYLGDSSFLVIRDGNVMLQPVEQEVGFNRPFQLGKLAGGLTYAQEPSDAEKFGFNMGEGGLIIFGTDGLFDNLFEADILEIVYADPNAHAADIAHTLASAAIERGGSADSSPFEVNSEAHGHTHKGGKIDDTTVIVVKKER